MILSQYIQNHFIQTINNIEINNQLIEINYYGEVISNFNYSNNNNIQFYKANNINIYNYWYFIQGPCNLYINYFQLINLQLNFSILSGKINTKEYEYIWKNIYIIYNILIQYKKENKEW